MGAALHEHITLAALVDPRHVGHVQTGVDELLRRPDSHDRGGVIDADHVPLRSSTRQAEPAALADRHQLERVDRADRVSGSVDDVGAAERYPAAEELLATAGRGHEAHVLAVGLGGGPQAEAGGDLADVGLGDLADREERAGEVALPQHVHHVALVLLTVDTALERVSTVRRPADPRVVAGCDGVEPEDSGPVGEPGELHVAIALDARVRRLAGDVGRHVRVDDVPVEVVAEVEHDVVDARVAARRAARRRRRRRCSIRCRSHHPTTAS